MPYVRQSKALEFLEVFWEFDGCEWTRIFFVMCEVNFKVFKLTLASEGIVENFYVSRAGSSDLSDLETLQALEFAENWEDHLIHDTIDILYLEVESEVSQEVFLQQRYHLMRFVQVFNQGTKDEWMSQLPELLTARKVV